MHIDRIEKRISNIEDVLDDVVSFLNVNGRTGSTTEITKLNNLEGYVLLGVINQKEQLKDVFKKATFVSLNQTRWFRGRPPQPVVIDTTFIYELARTITGELEQLKKELNKLKRNTNDDT